MNNLTKKVGLNILQSSQTIDLQAVTVGFTLLQSSQIIDLQAVRFLICSLFCKIQPISDRRAAVTICKQPPRRTCSKSEHAPGCSVSDGPGIYIYRYEKFLQKSGQKICACQKRFLTLPPETPGIGLDGIY